MNLSDSIDILKLRERLKLAVQKKQIMKDLDKLILSAHHTILPQLILNEGNDG